MTIKHAFKPFNEPWVILSTIIIPAVMALIYCTIDSALVRAWLGIE